MSNPYLESYLDSLNAPDFKEIVLRIEALSRRKRARMAELIQTQYDATEFEPGVQDYDVWNRQVRPFRRAIFSVLGVLDRHSVIHHTALTPDVARRVKTLLDQLESAESAQDVTEFPREDE